MLQVGFKSTTSIFIKFTS